MIITILFRFTIFIYSIICINAQYLRKSIHGLESPRLLQYESSSHSFISKPIKLSENSSAVNPKFWYAMNPFNEKFSWNSEIRAHQDRTVSEILNDKSNGYYVDLASNHYKLLSNTYSLDRYNNWTGLCIEPNPLHHIDILSNRRCALYINPVSDTPGQKIKFRFDNPTGGNIQATGGIVGADFDNHGNSTNDVELETATLTDILNHSKSPKIMDYLSLDVEGAEYHVLKGFNFDDYAFHIVSIERPNHSCHHILSKHGYRFVFQMSEYGECMYFHPSLPQYDYWIQKLGSNVTPRWHDENREYLLTHPKKQV